MPISLTCDCDYLEHAFNTWTFIKQQLKDGEGGEWFWGVYEDYTKMKEDKIGMWKCPYHNARACMELLDRFKMLTIKEVH